MTEINNLVNVDDHLSILFAVCPNMHEDIILTADAVNRLTDQHLRFCNMVIMLCSCLKA